MVISPLITANLLLRSQTMTTIIELLVLGAIFFFSMRQVLRSEKKPQLIAAVPNNTETPKKEEVSKKPSLPATQNVATSKSLWLRGVWYGALVVAPLFVLTHLATSSLHIPNWEGASVLKFLAGLTIIGVIGYGFYWYIKKPKDAATEGTKATEEDRKKILTKIFSVLAIGVILLLAWYILDKNDGFNIAEWKNHWFLGALFLILLLWIVIGGMSSGGTLIGGILIFGLFAYMTWLANDNGESNTATHSTTSSSHATSSDVAYWDTVEVPGDGQWHAVAIPAGERLKTLKCPGDALMRVEGPNVPSGSDEIDCGEGREFNIPERAFWGAVISFKAKYDATRARVRLISK